MQPDTFERHTYNEAGRGYQHEETAPVMHFSEWFVLLLMMCVPVLNFVLLIIWATDQRSNPNRTNWAKATLVIVGMQVVVWMFILGAFVGSLSSLFPGWESMGGW